jgi:hypothetical protein
MNASATAQPTRRYVSAAVSSGEFGHEVLTSGSGNCFLESVGIDVGLGHGQHIAMTLGVDDFSEGSTERRHVGVYRTSAPGGGSSP